MKNLKKESIIFVIDLILVLTVSAVFVALPAATAQKAYTKQTYAFIGATPNPVGVNHETLLHVGITDEMQDVKKALDEFFKRFML